MRVRAVVLVFAVLLASGAAIVRLTDPEFGDEGSRTAAGSAAAGESRSRAPLRYATRPASVRVRIGFDFMPRSGLLFDLRTGRVLWSWQPNRRQPIASLAKMMTAIVVNDRSRPAERVYISRRAVAAGGSKVGLLPRRFRVRLETLLYGLMLPSGNDAAVAVAEHVSGSVRAFVREMNETARLLGLRCSRFSSPSGLVDEGNFACASDLALLAREVLRRPRLARIVGTSYASFPFLVPHTAKVRGHRLTVYKPGRLHLATHNPLLRDGYPGATGVKTGYTNAAGRCLVGTATREGVSLGVVLLGSRDPGLQAARLLDAGFAAMLPRRAPPAEAPVVSIG